MKAALLECNVHCVEGSGGAVALARIEKHEGAKVGAGNILGPGSFRAAKLADNDNANINPVRQWD